MTACCKPAERDEDRTHHVYVRVAQFEEGQPVQDETDTLDIACTHNDAVLTAGLYADGRDWDVYPKPRGSNGTFIGSEIAEGDGVRVEIWVSRSLAGIEYDEQRAADPENWPCAYGPDHLAGVGYRLLGDGRAVCPELCWTETKEK